MKATRVEDVMSAKVVTVRGDMAFKDLVRAMYEARVSAVPVVDEDGRLVGIVSEADLLRSEDDVRHGGSKVVLLEWYVNPVYLTEIAERMEHLRARDIMTTEVVTVRPDTPVDMAIRVLLKAGVKRLPVIDADGRVIGIVSRRDLLSPFLRSDEDIRDEVVGEVIHRTLWMDPATIRVEVADGVVSLRGRVDRRSEREILEAMIRRVDGVVGIENELTYRIDDRELRVPPPAHPELGWSENWVRAR